MKKIFISIIAIVIVLLSSTLYIVINQKKDIAKLKCENASLTNTVNRLREDSARLETLLRDKEMNIKLDIKGVPERKGGGVFVNNIQKQ